MTLALADLETASETRRWHTRHGTEEIARRALDALDVAVLVVAADLDTVVHANLRARDWVGIPVTAIVWQAIATCVKRRAERHESPSLRVIVGDKTLSLKVTRHSDDGALEVVVLQLIAVPTDPFELLHARYGIRRSEYQILSALRLGKSARELARETSSTEEWVALEVHRLLERFCVPSRARLVELIEELLAGGPLAATS